VGGGTVPPLGSLHGGVDVAIIWTILIGFVVGAVAKFFMPGKQGGGFIMTTVLGIAGSFVGSFLSGMLGMGRTVGFIGSVIGAIIILMIARMVNKS
jgi:uncharacterized membrane protein YeaQ/YmgE (transglycosylase-associated protein family)